MQRYSASHQMIVLSCLALLLCAFTSGVISHDRKHLMCCTAYVPRLPHPKSQIKSCNILPATADCVAAVTFTDKSNKMYCIDPNYDATQLQRFIKRTGVTCVRV